MGQFIDALKLSQHFKVPLGGDPLNDSLEMTSVTRHTWQRLIRQPILGLGASSPTPAAVYTFAFLSCTLPVAEVRGRRLSVSLQRSVGCPVLLRGKSWGYEQLRATLARRSSTGETCWLHLQLFPAHNRNGPNLREVGILYQFAGF